MVLLWEKEPESVMISNNRMPNSIRFPFGGGQYRLWYMASQDLSRFKKKKQYSCLVWFISHKLSWFKKDDAIALQLIFHADTCFSMWDHQEEKQLWARNQQQQQQLQQQQHPSSNAIDSKLRELIFPLPTFTFTIANQFINFSFTLSCPSTNDRDRPELTLWTSHYYHDSSGSFYKKQKWRKMSMAIFLLLQKWKKNQCRDLSTPMKENECGDSIPIVINPKPALSRCGRDVLKRVALVCAITIITRWTSSKFPRKARISRWYFQKQGGDTILSCTPGIDASGINAATKESVLVTGYISVESLRCWVMLFCPVLHLLTNLFFVLPFVNFLTE